MNVIPLFYYNNVEPVKMEFEGMRVTERKTYMLDLKGNFPQNVIFSGKVVHIQSAEYREGKLIVKFLPDNDNLKTNNTLGLESVCVDNNDDSKEYSIEGHDNTFVISRRNPKDSEKPLPLEKKDTYEITISAKYIINKKVEIPLKK